MFVISMCCCCCVGDRQCAELNPQHANRLKLSIIPAANCRSRVCVHRQLCASSFCWTCSRAIQLAALSFACGQRVSASCVRV